MASHKPYRHADPVWRQWIATHQDKGLKSPLTNTYQHCLHTMLDKRGRSVVTLERIKIGWWRKRIAHVAIAAACILALGSIDGFAPLDWFVRMSQSVTFTKDASGQIIFVSLRSRDAIEPGDTHHDKLALLIDGLERNGAAGTYLDFEIVSGSDGNDARLRQALGGANHAWIVNQVRRKQDGIAYLGADASFRTPNPRLVSYALKDAFGYIWFDAPEKAAARSHAANLPVSLAGRDDGPSPFRIDYSYRLNSIPQLSLDDALALLERAPGTLAGKRVVVGYEASMWQGFAAIPGNQKVAPSLVAIYAAETLRGGVPGHVPWTQVVAILGAVLTLGALIGNRHVRHITYTAIVIGQFAVFCAPPLTNVFVDLGAAFGFTALYAVMRGWSNLRDRGRLVSDVTGLPTFRLLESELARSGADEPCALVIARIHRFDEVLATLDKARHRDFVELVASRFRAADEDLVIHSNDGRYLAWMQDCDSAADLEAHLRGLRALFAYPLNLSGVDIDVGVTFAADFSRADSPAQRLANAMAAVDGTSEASQPVCIATPASREDRVWRLSLQTKIDRALHSGEIFVVYQPQFDLASGALTGCEALVRWNDRERGAIAPSYFIEQCELVGRMESLTRKVLEDATRAFRSVAECVPGIRLSVNMSATLLGNAGIVDMVTNVLKQTGLPPERLTIEITETARIADFDIAGTIMQRLRTLGIAMSIDDFGVGTANFDTLCRLPFDEIKIDRMFVARMAEDIKALSLVEASVAIARRCGVAIVAEGVETKAMQHALIRIGCSTGQGFGLARPGPMPIIDALCHEQCPRKSA